MGRWTSRGYSWIDVFEGRSPQAIYPWKKHYLEVDCLSVSVPGSAIWIKECLHFRMKGCHRCCDLDRALSLKLVNESTCI